ncbi:Retrovirus-related Pol polyprotein from transposon opus [Sesamum angolense]|uniref:Retrovirus-related Pol polyprotein from transposon opus n=1 Tax=Sesamum angolense TaxID=2727404 RepID=A0AAE1WR39_9LAMI|nr:Retrovirus-related Pol polyprotein from transposon opus [Sesamum angolense]
MVIQCGGGAKSSWKVENVHGLYRPEQNMPEGPLSTTSDRLAGATYQRLVNKMFKDLIGKTMEVYVDDMLVKSKEEEEHLNHLQAAFEVMRKYGMKLNPTKCMFGVRGEKFLGYMGGEEFQWTEECDQTLHDLKQYLATPPLLANPKVVETLYLSLAVSEEAVSSALV